MKQETIFDEGGYTVVRSVSEIAGSPYTEYIVSDGDYSCSLGYEPAMSLESIREEMNSYLQNRKDDMDSEGENSREWDGE